MQVQAVGLGNEALIRVAQQVPTKELSEEKVQAAANDKVKGALGENIEVRRIEVVGPTVSAELKRTGVIAVVASMFGILLYVWFRFEWQFAVAAILALSHDVFITVGMFSLLWYEFDLSVVAAILTLAGYSINDTVVVFDRIRENLRRYKRMPLIELLNLSINETLSRTVLTSVTTALAVLALYIFGTRGDPRLLVRHAVRHRHRHLFVDLRRRAASCCCSASSASGAARPPRRRPRRSVRQAAARERGLEMTRRTAPLSWAGADRCLWQRRLPLRRDEPSRLDPVPAERGLRLARRASPTRSRRPRCARAGREGRARSAAARHRPAPAAARCADVRRAFDAAGVALEAMDTGAACRTYNVLLAEGRPVGGAAAVD